MRTYCLGYSHVKCATCQHEKNWQALNQMPNALRLAIQNGAQRINDEKCRLTGMGMYEEGKS